MWKRREDNETDRRGVREWMIVRVRNDMLEVVNRKQVESILGIESVYWRWESKRWENTCLGEGPTSLPRLFLYGVLSLSTHQLTRSREMNNIDITPIVSVNCRLISA